MLQPCLAKLVCVIADVAAPSTALIKRARICHVKIASELGPCRLTNSISLRPVPSFPSFFSDLHFFFFIHFWRIFESAIWAIFLTDDTLVPNCNRAWWATSLASTSRLGRDSSLSLIERASSQFCQPSTSRPLSTLPALLASCHWWSRFRRQLLHLRQLYIRLRLHSHFRTTKALEAFWITIVVMASDRHRSEEMRRIRINTFFEEVWDPK